METAGATRRRRARALLARLFVRTLPTLECPICLDDVAAGDARISLHCGHQFCHDCVRSYVNGKVRARQVHQDQLVCPVVKCKRSLRGRDLRRILDRELYEQYKATRLRLRDEKNPLARWCPRPQCGQLIVYEALPATTFTCPSCATVGCVHCRGPAHRFAFLCHASPSKTDDASYLKWEQSIGDGRAVRACPKCQMRIWKTEGCNHMTCTHCYHQYCWACDAHWHRRHYACGADTDARNSTDAMRRLAAQFEILLARFIVGLIACISAIVLTPTLALVTVVRKLPLVVQVGVQVGKALAVGTAALLAVPFLLVLTLYDAWGEQKPRRRLSQLIGGSRHL